MKSKMLAWIAVISVFTLPAMPVRVLAQEDVPILQAAKAEYAKLR
jgi:hypothetical protein